MDSYWSQIDRSVQKNTNLSASQYSKELEKNSSLIVDFLSFNLYPDVLGDSGTLAVKQKILKLYTKDIAPVVSKIEVYAHDLPPEIVEAIYNLLQYIIASEFTDIEADRVISYSKTLSYTYFIKYLFQESLVRLLIQRINSYQRMVRDFTHQGVLVGKISLLKAVNKRLAKAKREHVFIKLKHKTMVLFDRCCGAHTAKIDMEGSSNDMNFDGLITELESIEDLFTDNLADVLSNGYNRRLSFRLFRRTLDLVSAYFVLHWFLSAIGVWDSIIKLFNQFGK